MSLEPIRDVSHLDFWDLNVLSRDSVLIQDGSEARWLASAEEVGGVQTKMNHSQRRLWISFVGAESNRTIRASDV